MKARTIPATRSILFSVVERINIEQVFVTAAPLDNPHQVQSPK